MKADLLWATPAHRAWLIASVTAMSLLGFIATAETRIHYASAYFVVTASILLFVFLTRLPTGSVRARVLFELICLGGSVGLFVVGSIGISWFLTIPEDRISEQALIIFSLLCLFSHTAVRVFARASATWVRMRQRSLVWEITHAQLRLVMLTMIVLFVILIFSLFFNVSYTSLNFSDFIANGITLFISIAGFFGIITGLLLLIVIVPAAIISYITARKLTRRIEHLTAATRSVRDVHDYSPVTVEGDDEVTRLQLNFNQMMSRLETALLNLERERDTVRQLLTVRQRLFADVSHELRTPITTIRSYIESMKTEDTDENTAIIEREVLRLQHLIDDVFAFARADVDQLPYVIKPLEIGGILERTTRVMHRQAWQARKVDVVLEYQPQLPLVMADSERLEQVLYNLMQNATRHTPPGGLVRVAAAAQADLVRIDVQDTGEGIAAQDLPHIWERFYRSPETRLTSPEGAGLGLALVKEMIEAMGGQVGVTSKPGNGSCFSLTLPRIN